MKLNSPLKTPSKFVNGQNSNGKESSTKKQITSPGRRVSSARKRPLITRKEDLFNLNIEAIKAVQDIFEMPPSAGLSSRKVSRLSKIRSRQSSPESAKKEQSQSGSPRYLMNGDLSPARELVVR